jgi:hypothetical protein
VRREAAARAARGRRAVAAVEAPRRPARHARRDRRATRAARAFVMRRHVRVAAAMRRAHVSHRRRNRCRPAGVAAAHALFVAKDRRAAGGRAAAEVRVAPAAARMVNACPHRTRPAARTAAFARRAQMDRRAAVRGNACATLLPARTAAATEPLAFPMPARATVNAERTARRARLVAAARRAARPRGCARPREAAVGVARARGPRDRARRTVSSPAIGSDKAPRRAAAAVTKPTAGIAAANPAEAVEPARRASPILCRIPGPKTTSPRCPQGPSDKAPTVGCVFKSIGRASRSLRRLWMRARRARRRTTST